MASKIIMVCICLVLISLVFSPEPAQAFNNGDTPVNTPDSARRMIEDLINTYPAGYPKGQQFLNRLDKIEAELKKGKNDNSAQTALANLIAEASLANPLLGNDKILVIRRTKEANRNLNSHTTETIKRTGWDNEITELSNLRGNINTRTVYRHPNDSVMKHMELQFDGNRLMFSGIGKNGNWAILEIDTNGKNLKELTPTDQQDVQWFDGCYLPEQGKILACSTAGMQGLPCENGGRPMVNLYRVDADTKDVRQLTFEQDSDWHPRVLHNGQVLYLRWEYTDTPHYYSRYLFHMNPDGTGQREHWGSGSYFPTAFVWARPVPNHPSMVVGIVSGHHAKSETGRLMIINPALARKYPFRYTPKEKTWGKEKTQVNIHPTPLDASETGCVQEIPGFNKNVVGNVYDNQGGNQKYTFGTPYPLSEKYFLVSLKKGDKWVLALVDIFDNMTTVYEDPKYSIFEPIPLTERPTPQVIADRTTSDPTSVIFCTDIYDGPGLKDIPPGTVKKLRVFTYHYGYIKSGGHESCGLESSWDIKRILGTVPVEPDGSFSFQAPANTPLSIQPLDKDGAAVALMRSWMVGMGGEVVSCNGCHENQNEATQNKLNAASRRQPDSITPWYGPARPFGYTTEVQPTLDKYCMSCHNDTDKKGNISFAKGDPSDWNKDRSYLNLVAFARRPGPESDLEMYNPMEWHVSTSPLIQMLKKGHHGVELDEEAWSRLYTWIDLNAPHRGMWNNPNYERKRLDLAKQYASVSYNPEQEHRQSLAAVANMNIEQVPPSPPVNPEPDNLSVPGFPLTTEQAKQLQGDSEAIQIQLENNQVIDFVKIPAGSFIMGSTDSYQDEAPRSAVDIDKPFWMAATEITNAQYAAFDQTHDTRYLDENGKDHSVPGYIANHPNQPVARISWKQAMAYCNWLSDKTGKKVSLPTEAQWEYASRAGTETQFFFGDKDSDFSEYANLADASRRKTYVKWDGGSQIHVKRNYPADSLYPLRDDRYTDKWFVVDYVKQYPPNQWGLYDMAGNVSEWTRSNYQPYPYRDKQANNLKPEAKKVARGGSWNDRPKTAGSTIRFAYQPHQKVYNTGFRVIIE